MLRLQKDRWGKHLHLTIYWKYFDPILLGTKIEEYRNRTKYWISRLRGKHYDFIVFRNGYGHHRPYLICRCLDIQENDVRNIFVIYLGEIVAWERTPKRKDGEQ